MISFNEWLTERTLTEGLRAIRLQGKPYTIVVGNVTLKLMKNAEWGEIVVAWIENGKYNDDASYHTGGQDKDHLQDAINTMRDMAQREQKRQAASQQQQQPPVQAPQAPVQKPDDPSLHHLTYDELSPRP